MAVSPRKFATGLRNQAVSLGVMDNTGELIYPDSMPTTDVTRDAAGNLLTMTKSNGENTWVYTITRDANGNFASDGDGWVRQ